MSEVKNQTNQNQKIKHPILPSKCSSCNNDCIEMFNEETRLKKHEEFCKIDYDWRRMCGLLKQLSNVHLRDQKKETKNMRERKSTRVYKLKSVMTIL